MSGDKSYLYVCASISDTLLQKKKKNNTAKQKKKKLNPKKKIILFQHRHTYIHPYIRSLYYTICMYVCINNSRYKETDSQKTKTKKKNIVNKIKKPKKSNIVNLAKTEILKDERTRKK